MSEFSFDSVFIPPIKSSVPSRDLVDLSVDLGTKRVPFKLDLPVFSANMPTITELKMAFEMNKRGGVGVVHRFMSVKENVRQFKTFVDNVSAYNSIAYDEHDEHDESEGSSEIRNNVVVSVGVQDECKERAEHLYEAGARIFCVDVAHGHHDNVKNAIKDLRKVGGKDIIIIAGNIVTVDAADDLSDWGADIVKVGVGPGSVCWTRKNTGVGYPQLLALKNIRDEFPNIKMIADGGMSEPGHISKALVYADAVMLGRMIAGTTESPGNAYRNTEGKWYKNYGGSSSGETKTGNGKEAKFVEGVMMQVPFQGEVKFVLKEIKEGVQSSCAYVNSWNLRRDFKENAKLVRTSDGKEL
jgi:IMP dehydrogenase